MIQKIISGGQTGADRGGLNAAIERGVMYGGWCPKGRRAEDGIIPPQYQLQETSSYNYLERTEKNVLDADATAIFTYKAATGGSKKTIEFAKRHQKDWKHFDLDKYDNVKIAQQVIAWLSKYSQDIVLNIAGSRESKNKGIQIRVQNILLEVINNFATTPQQSRFPF